MWLARLLYCPASELEFQSTVRGVKRVALLRATVPGGERGRAVNKLLDMWFAASREGTFLPDGAARGRGASSTMRGGMHLASSPIRLDQFG